MNSQNKVEVGQEVFWLHGQHSHRWGKVLAISEEGVVTLEGVTKVYTMKYDTLIKKLSKPYPEWRVWGLEGGIYG